MNVKYYYCRDKERRGPVSLADLRNLAAKGELRRTDRVWTKGMPDWESAISVVGLFDDLPPDLETETAGANFPAMEMVGLRKQNITSDRRKSGVADRSEPLACSGQQSSFASLPQTTRVCDYCGRENALDATCCVECGTTEFHEKGIQPGEGPGGNADAHDDRRHNALTIAASGSKEDRSQGAEGSELRRFLMVIIALVVIVVCALITAPSMFALFGTRANQAEEARPPTRKELEAQVMALRPQLSESIRQALTGLNLQNGVPFMGSNEEIQRTWGQALRVAEQLRALEEELKRQDSGFEGNILLDAIVDHLKAGMERRNRSEEALKQHAVLSDDESRVAAAFLVDANLIARAAGLPEPFPPSRMR